ncbi:hypothetical protein FHL81_10830 [Agrobacterium tumefaciens]|uniref:hypothetical protein n=1 Tax=Agrobacterium tumefaciens TaxID=358 RepID=UPI0011F35403|nr:hypothetical protein [Agrobacterium tumefaciens]KAA1237125.1 hypothetical protein FHL81_10830 [Agrobacterium tumefaciens]
MIDLLKKYSADYLLEIAASVSLTNLVGDFYRDAHGDMLWGDETHDAKDGWKVVIFWDGGEYDYVDHWISPEGEVICPWDWPHDFENHGTDRDKLICFRGDDLTEYLSRFQRYKDLGDFHA